MNGTLFVYLVLLAFVLLPGLKIAKKGEYIEQPYELVVTKGMQGFFALCILVHHVSLVLRYYQCYDGQLEFFENLGTLFVGFFFLCSGYGLIVSFEIKNHYLDTFVKKRVLMVLVPFFICNYIYMFTTQIFGQDFTTKELIQAFFGVLLLNDHMWFVVEIMILYMLFYFVFRYIKKDFVRFTVIGCFIVIMIIGSFLSGHDNTVYQQANWFRGEWWYNTTILFFVGMLFGKYRDRLIIFAKRHYKVLLAAAVVVFVYLYMLTMYVLFTHGYWTETETDMAYGDKALTFAVQVPMVLSFEILLSLIMLKVRMNNKLLDFLGKISLEMILLEKTFMLIFMQIGIDSLFHIHLYMFLVVASTILGAIVINKIKMEILERK